MAVGTSQSAICHREPAGSRQQYWHGGGRECAAGRINTLLLVGASSAINATLYEKLNFNFLRGITPSPSFALFHKTDDGWPGREASFTSPTDRPPLFGSVARARWCINFAG
jgi:hypothetical protein